MALLGLVAEDLEYTGVVPSESGGLLESTIVYCSEEFVEVRVLWMNEGEAVER
jgi:hypothetical protein